MFNAGQVIQNSRAFCVRGGRAGVTPKRGMAATVPGLYSVVSRRNGLYSLMTPPSSAPGGEASPPARLSRAKCAQKVPLCHPPPLAEDGARGPSRGRLRLSQDFGTILVNLDLRRVVDLIPDRAAESFSAWLRQHPEIVTISRDRCGLYAEGATLGAPQSQ